MLMGMGGGTFIPLGRMAIAPSGPVDEIVKIELPLAKAEINLLSCRLLSLEINPQALGDPDILSSVLGEIISLSHKRQVDFRMQRIPAKMGGLFDLLAGGPPAQASTEGSNES